MGVELRRPDEDHANPKGNGHWTKRRRVQAERTERVFRADALLAKDALDALPDDRIGQQVRGADDERATTRPMQGAGADAREIGEKRAEAGAPFEVAEETRVGRIRIVDDGRGRARLVGDEQVDLEPGEARGKLRIFAFA